MRTTSVILYACANQMNETGQGWTSSVCVYGRGRNRWLRK